MDIKEAQEAVDEWIRTVGGRYFSELTNMALLTEEVGELARVIARVYGEQVAKEGDLRKSLSEELADVLWVVICLANQTGVDLTQAFRESLEKKRTRDKNRFKTTDGETGYGIDGLPRAYGKGLNIIRHADGSVTKKMVR